jgi:peroxiredoxin
MGYTNVSALRGGWSAWLAAQYPTESGQSTDARVGSPAPDFELDDLDGNRVKLSDLRGRPVVLNFWATWCGPCRVEMPAIEQVYQTYREQGVVVLGVDVQEPPAKVSEFVKNGNFSWRFALDSRGEVMRQYRVVGLPTSVFIDKDGVFRDVVIGAAIRPTFEGKLSRLLQ